MSAHDALPRLAAARMHFTDVVSVGGVGLRTRPLRAFLSALGIAIGIAAMVAVVGISSSSSAGLDRTLSALGTNLLTVSAGTTLLGEEAKMPFEAESMIERIGPVEAVSAVAKVAAAKVYRSEQIPEQQTGGMTTYAARLDLLPVVGATVRSGAWLNAATENYPAVVLGATAARRLGIGAASPDAQVVIGGVRFTVVGILNPVPLAEELDSGALVGWPVAQSRLDFDGHPTVLYTRAEEPRLESVRSVLAGTANPQAPNEVDVSRPSDVLTAKQATSQAFTGLLLGVGGVALIVGGVGVANTMVISVLERRPEIGLRRSLGATRGQIRTQFLAESLLLSAMGGAGGVLIGSGVTVGYALAQDLPPVIPGWAVAGGLLATLVIGAVAGLYPAIRASRLSPTEALATP
ncbi:putative ABC transport system permease protein [Thermocatellispora tengchongensis]|uniref:Putative ABC transport system permease protein n=1 Tax=Thermocatellispora tengchongensis TaxID=1073253 RepID=A0A840PMW8_9ACTN|nr:ABC transporter permease [Thermocatellispora tengchongensis]MBB5140392.1 putative ABC transport system permease protein [Thermocatellispora tengchongensis]